MGTNVSKETRNKGCTHGFILTFKSETDRDTYIDHPAHKEFGKLVGPVLDDVFVIDFWAKDSAETPAYFDSIGNLHCSSKNPASMASPFTPRAGARQCPPPRNRAASGSGPRCWSSADGQTNPLFEPRTDCMQGIRINQHRQVMS